MQTDGVFLRYFRLYFGSIALEDIIGMKHVSFADASNMVGRALGWSSQKAGVRDRRQQRVELKLTDMTCLLIGSQRSGEW
ncbi:MAG: hypothetical protein ACXV5H_09310 [Halobacteriota archaeon]